MNRVYCRALLTRAVRQNTYQRNARIVRRCLSSFNFDSFFDDEPATPRRGGRDEHGGHERGGRGDGGHERGGRGDGGHGRGGRGDGGHERGGNGNRSNFGHRSNGRWDDDAPEFGGKATSFGGGSRNNDDFSFDNLREINWESESLEKFTADFYKDRELDSVKNRDPEDVKQFRESNSMMVFGSDIPNPIFTFQESTLDDSYLNMIAKAGIAEPSPIQKQGIPMALSGRDMIGVSKTGSGKTLAFVVPAIVHINAQPILRPGDGPICLVLAPTRELAVQIENEVKNFSKGENTVRSAVVYGGASRGPQINAMERQPEILIATPGRLLDFISCGVVNLKRTSYLVLDEADRMLDMGFEKDLKQIMNQCRPDRQTLMFSATWPKEVQSIAKGFTKDACRVQVGDLEITANENIHQVLKVVNDQREKDKEFFIDIKAILDKGEKVLVFANQKKIVDNIAYHLSRYQVKCGALHGDKSQRTRDDVMNAFRSGQSSVCIATDVCARGIDIRDIAVVINYDMPTDVESYVHRIGRTARAGDTGTSIGYMMRDDLDRLSKDLVPLLKRAGQEVPSFLENHRSPPKSKYNNGRNFGGSRSGYSSGGSGHSSGGSGRRSF